jgi:hypothetical protein
MTEGSSPRYSEGGIAKVASIITGGTKLWHKAVQKVTLSVDTEFEIPVIAEFARNADNVGSETSEGSPAQYCRRITLL